MSIVCIIRKLIISTILLQSSLSPFGDCINKAKDMYTGRDSTMTADNSMVHINAGHGVPYSSRVEGRGRPGNGSQV